MADETKTLIQWLREQATSVLYPGDDDADGQWGMDIRREYCERLTAATDLIESQSATIACLTRERDEAREVVGKIRVDIDELASVGWKVSLPEDGRDVFMVEVFDWRRLVNDNMTLPSPAVKPKSLDEILAIGLRLPDGMSVEEHVKGLRSPNPRRMPTMPDISMCLHRTCPQRTTCKRHADSGTQPDKHWQSYAGWQPTINEDKVECDGYWPKENRNGNDG